MGLELGGSQTQAPVLGGGEAPALGGGINLSKGQKISLEKMSPGLKVVTVGLGWDVNRAQGGDFDLDTQAFLLDANDKAVSASHFIYYNNKSFGGVTHNGDNRTGQGEGDDESMTIVLDSVPSDVQKITITASIYDALVRKQNFGQVSNAYIRLLDDAGNQLCKYDLSEDYSTSMSLVVADLYRHNGEWKFSASGKGYDYELGGLLSVFGLA